MRRGNSLALSAASPVIMLERATRQTTEVLKAATVPTCRPSFVEQPFYEHPPATVHSLTERTQTYSQWLTDAPTMNRVKITAGGRRGSLE